MKNFYLFIVLLNLLTIAPLKGQQEEIYVTETTTPVVAEDFGNMHVMQVVSLSKTPITGLSSKITLRVNNSNLIDVLKEIQKKSNITFIYEDELLDIDGVEFFAENKTVYEALYNLLEPHGISFYEFQTNKVALAKKDKIDERTGEIFGKIKDETGELLIGANVMLKELGIGSASDTKGYFSIRNVKPGNYTLEVSFVGYDKYVGKIIIVPGKKVELNIILKSSAFQIGGIEVVGTTDLLPKDVSTKTYINSGEIEHYQASSLKDVLDLVPGVQKTDNPGLGKTSQIAIRGDEGDNLSAFGTLIMVDGVPMSNNANLQFERLSGSKFGSSTLGAGIDLRTIPADNIESIEVITGLPSVRYGDVTAGVINVQTKIGKSPHRLKFKNNPDTREGNLGGGFLLGDYGLSYNVNLAQSERDIRKTGDEYFRLTGQTVFSGNYWDNALNLNNKINFQTIYDEEEPRGDVQKTKNYNRGFSLGFTTWGKYKPEDGVSAFDFNIFTTMRRENTMKSRLVQSDLRILPNGDTVSIYLGKVETRGIEWTLGGRLEWNRVFYTGNIIHKFLLGVDPQYNANTGEGLVFDTLFSIYGAESGRRPYSFNDIPGQLLMNIYAEDKLTGNLFFDYNLMLGFRYEMYRPYEFNLSGLWGDGDIVKSHQGTFFNPRANLMIYFSEFNQLRLSAGTTSKSPSMNRIYPPEEVFTWRNPIDSSVNYFRYDTRVPDLKGYKETQFEAAFDQKIYEILGISVSAYYKKRISEPEGETVPVFFVDSSPTGKKAFYIDNYSLYSNIGYTNSKGIEFSFRTKKIKPLNMDFQIVGSYNFLKYGSNGIVFSNLPDTAKGQYPNISLAGLGVDTLIGWSYPSNEKWNDRFQLNYYIKYTNAVLGLWVTLRIEQLVSERRQSFSSAPVVISKLNETQLTSYYFEREIKLKPNKWLFNLNISKSLFKGAEVSFYVNNFLDDDAIYRYWSSPTRLYEEIRNPSLSYGIEFSMILDNFF